MNRNIIATVTALSLLAAPALAQQSSYGTYRYDQPSLRSPPPRYIPHDPKDDEWSTTTKFVVGGIVAMIFAGILMGDTGSTPTGSGNSSADLDARLRAAHQGGGGHTEEAPTQRSYGLYGTDHCLGRC